jgi:hypothetical protein
MTVTWILWRDQSCGRSACAGLSFSRSYRLPPHFDSSRIPKLLVYVRWPKVMPEWLWVESS